MPIVAGIFDKYEVGNVIFVAALIRIECSALNENDNDAKNRPFIGVFAHMQYGIRIRISLMTKLLAVLDNYYHKIIPTKLYFSTVAGSEKGPEKIHYHKWFPLIASNKDTKAV